MPEQINVVGKYKTKTAVAQPNRTATEYIVIHHAAWPYPRGEALRLIFNYHSSQWPKYGRIGYHEVIQEEADGHLQRYLVNAPDMVGAGVAKQNHRCYHICAATHFQDSIPEQHWIDELARAAADVKRRYPNASIVGHTEITLPGHGTSCPGSKWKAWKPGFVAQVGRIFVPPAADPWAAWGNEYPLPPEQRHFGIPTLWFENRRWLKEARTPTLYPLGTEAFVIQVFRGGFIWSQDGVCQVKQMAKELE